MYLHPYLHNVMMLILQIHSNVHHGNKDLLFALYTLISLNLMALYLLNFSFEVNLILYFISV